jgi:hypothetical protein
MNTVTIGSGTYSTTLPDGQLGVTSWQGVPLSPLVTDTFSSTVPSTDWWSSLVFPHFDDSYSAPLFAHPLAMQAVSEGLSLGYTPFPKFISSDSLQHVKYEFTYHSDLSIGIEGLNAANTELMSYSDWAVTGQWSDSDSSNTLQATMGHGMPFVYFEKQGSEDVVISLEQHDANTIGQPNQSVESFVLTNVNGVFSNDSVDFNLALNTAGADGSAAGNSAQARVSIDNDSDGRVDFSQTYNFIPLDADESGTENYQQNESRGIGAETFGELGDLNNATVTVELWQAFGLGDVTLSTGSDSYIDLPYANVPRFYFNDENTISTTASASAIMTLGGESEESQFTWDGAGTIWYHDNNVVGVTINGNHYGLFAPTNSQWNTDNGEIRSDLAGQDYFSVALLPDNSIETLGYFYDHAFAFITDTSTEYVFDQDNSEVVTTFNITTELKEAGFADEALTNLYRHQWINSDDELTEYFYQSPRGEMKLLEGNAFSTTHDFTGVLPALPNVMNAESSAGLYLEVDVIYQHLSSLPDVVTGLDTYWVGKAVARLGELSQIANQVGHEEAKGFFLTTMKGELEDWFSVDANNPDDKQF